jgi:hypothetical protein
MKQFSLLHARRLAMQLRFEALLVSSIWSLFPADHKESSTFSFFKIITLLEEIQHKFRQKALFPSVFRYAGSGTDFLFNLQSY